ALLDLLPAPRGDDDDPRWEDVKPACHRQPRRVPLLLELRTGLQVLDGPSVVGHRLGRFLVQDDAEGTRALLVVQPLLPPEVPEDDAHALHEDGVVLLRHNYSSSNCAIE